LGWNWMVSLPWSRCFERISFFDFFFWFCTCVRERFWSRRSDWERGRKMMNTANAVLERNAVPDWILRAGIRRLLGQRLEMEKERSRNPEYKWSFMEELRKLDIAVQMDSANEQHYQVPTEFYLLVLGPCLKYSSCYFPNASTTLEEAEEEMLLKTVQRGDLKDGMDVLDLGCGWGSLTLYIAKNYPKCKITSVSNSWTQKKHIDSICNERNYKNVRVETADVNSVRATRTCKDLLRCERELSGTQAEIFSPYKVDHKVPIRQGVLNRDVRAYEKL